MELCLYLPMRNLGTITRGCKHCHKSFVIRVAWLRRGTNKGDFCSKSCGARWRGALRRISIEEKKRRKAVYDKKRYPHIRQGYLQRLKDKAQKLRTVVLLKYSNGTMRCACCNIDYVPFLSLDHINSDGNKHRRELRQQGVSTGLYFYKWIIDNNFPSIFRVLCFNCNKDAYRNHGKCGCQI